MNEQLTPDAQRHLQVLQRYMLAMESGDIDSMSLVLHEAEVDPALEKMILEVNDFYQQEDHTVADAVDVMQAQQLLHDSLPATSQIAIPAFSSESIETSESCAREDTRHYAFTDELRTTGEESADPGFTIQEDSTTKMVSNPAQLVFSSHCSNTGCIVVITE